MLRWPIGYSRGAFPPSVPFPDWQDPRVPCFFSNVKSLAEIAARHLIEGAVTSCLYVGYSGSRASSKRGVELAAALPAGDFAFKLVQYTTDCLLGGFLDDEKLVRREKRLIELLRTSRKPLGVWTVNDNYARAVCLLCEDLRLRVPVDVRVLGCDDLAVARTSRPTISSIRTPGEQAGYLAMRTLDNMLKGSRPPRHPVEVTGAELAPRRSTVESSATKGDLEDILEYMARHACASLTVEDLSENFMVSRRKLEKQFRAAVGHSPGQEIQRVRLEQAKKLLGQSQLSISRTCFDGRLRRAGIIQQILSEAGRHEPAEVPR